VGFSWNSHTSATSARISSSTFQLLTFDLKLSSVPPDSKRDNQQLAMAMELPLIIVAAIGIAGLLGFFLDRWLHTKPVFMLIFGAAGFAIGVRDVLRRLPDK
jgi:F0F1-type ATP synthase assembly protein I